MVSRALYDFDNAFTYGLSLNYSRLQRLRPGYGYSRVLEKNASKVAPADDGVFHIDLQTGKEKLLFSLADLAQDVRDEGKHYINHLCVCPLGERFVFFHLWTRGVGQGSKMRFGLKI